VWYRCVSKSDCAISEERLVAMADQFQEVRDSLRAVGFTDQVGGARIAELGLVKGHEAL